MTLPCHDPHRHAARLRGPGVDASHPHAPAKHGAACGERGSVILNHLPLVSA